MLGRGPSRTNVKRLSCVSSDSTPRATSSAKTSLRTSRGSTSTPFRITSDSAAVRLHLAVGHSVAERSTVLTLTCASGHAACFLRQVVDEDVVAQSLGIGEEGAAAIDARDVV